MLNNQSSKKKVMYFINEYDKAGLTTKILFEDFKGGGRGGILSFQCFVESPERSDFCDWTD